MDQVEKVRSIEDPIERVTAAAELVRQREERAEGARQVRDQATIIAHLDDGVAPAEMYRDVLDCSRGLFVRIIQRAPAKRGKMSDAKEQARSSAKAVRKHEAVIERAREIRDSTALLLMTGGKDPVTGLEVERVSNAEIARVTGLTTARVAQIRAGTR